MGGGGQTKKSSVADTVAEAEKQGFDVTVINKITNAPRVDDAKVPEAWKTTKTSNRHAYDRKDDTTLLLKTDEFVLDDKVDWDTTTLLVYAETVKITHERNFPGKTLGIFCNNLKLSLPCMSLGVSGDPGKDVVPNGTIDGAAKGMAGGTIIVYIEELDDALVPVTSDSNVKTGLYLHARGGKGGTGANMSSGAGGSGGDGGTGGIIQLYCGHHVFDETAQLIEGPENTNWWARALVLSKFEFGKQVSTETATAFRQFASAHAEVQKALLDAQSELIAVGFKGAPKHDELLQTKERLLKAIVSALKIQKEPALVQSAKIENYTASFTALKTRKASDPEPWPALEKTFADFEAALSIILTPLSDETSVLKKRLEEIDQANQQILSDILTNFQSTYTSASRGGDGGKGGSPSSSSFGNGATGQAGGRSEHQKKAMIHPMSFKWTVKDLTIGGVLAHPDECQMLLNTADDLYFNSAADGNTASAEILYRRLSRRLGFIELLLEEEDKILKASKKTGGTPTPAASDSQKSSALAMAYGTLASKQLTFQPLTQILAVKKQADRCLTQISQKQDLFGNVGNWVPRLSYTFYESRIATMTTRIRLLEDSLKSYGTDPTDALNKAIINAQRQAADNEVEAQNLTGKDGPLNSAAAQIDSFTPILKTKREELHRQLDQLASDIKKTKNTDPKIFIDALSMIAMGHGWFNAGAQAGSAAYKMMTTVHSTKGEDVDKDYVVSQFMNAGKTFDDLETGYRSREDCTIEVDDPKAAKLLASETEIDKLLKEFAESIPAQSRDTIRIELAVYKDIIKQRNNAVLLWNAAINQLAKVRENAEYYKRAATTKGNDLLSADSDIPAYIFFVRKSVRDLHHRALQHLDFGRRALSYWAIPEKKPTKDGQMTVQEELPQWQQIDEMAATLSSNFDTALARYATNFGMIFPNYPDRSGPNRVLGRTHSLTSSDIDLLKVRQGPDIDPNDSKTNDKGFYQINVTIPFPTRDSSGADYNFVRHCNVRLHQVRLWLYGVVVNGPPPPKPVTPQPVTAPNSSGGEGQSRDVASQPAASTGEDNASPAQQHPLAIHLQHLGNEIITGTDANFTPYSFNHDVLPLSFRYFPKTVKGRNNIVGAQVEDGENIPGIFLGQPTDITTSSMAQFGPFATWNITVFEQDNPGLDMKGLTGGCFEFWGSAQEPAP